MAVNVLGWVEASQKKIKVFTINNLVFLSNCLAIVCVCPFSMYGTATTKMLT